MNLIEVEYDMSAVFLLSLRLQLSMPALPCLLVAEVGQLLLVGLVLQSLTAGIDVYREQMKEFW